MYSRQVAERAVSDPSAACVSQDSLLQVFQWVMTLQRVIKEKTLLSTSTR